MTLVSPDPRVVEHARVLPLALDSDIKTQPELIDGREKSARPAILRQYDLVDRVRRYNPKTDEALLNRAYVYAMMAHGAQTRASGDPYFNHPIEVAAIL